MSQTWHSAEAPEPVTVTPAGWLRVLLRGGPLALLLLVCFPLLLLIRLFEAPVFGQRRLVTPYITCFVCRSAFALMGMGFSSRGAPMAGAGGVVANHSSWLDIFALNARHRIVFVSKAEVAGWPGIGWLARGTGTLFIERNRHKAREQQQMFKDQLRAGQRLVFFPEGTSTDGMRVLPFKTTLFQAFFTPGLNRDMQIQPVTVIYRAPRGESPRFYGWWGDMGFGTHLLKVLSAPRQGAVELVYHPPVQVAAFASRKALAAHLEQTVRGGLPFINGSE